MASLMSRLLEDGRTEDAKLAAGDTAARKKCRLPGDLERFPLRYSRYIKRKAGNKT